MSKPSIVDGVFAIHKPQSLSSAQVVRDVQAAFTRSNLFSSSLIAEKADRARLSVFQKKRRKDKSVKVKVGHGGTLDPLATGVLIIGIGKGTKSLQNFLRCSKTYEVDLLFGVATDTYDILGKVLDRAPYAHITQDKIENVLGDFQGGIMQRPPIYSALRVQGKHLYEYAREGKEVPSEIQERPVTVYSLQVTNWLEDHDYQWPKEEAGDEEKEVAKRVLYREGTAVDTKATASDPVAQIATSSLIVDYQRRKRSEDSLEVAADTNPPPLRRLKRTLDTFAADEKENSLSVADIGPKNQQARPTSQAISSRRPPVVSLRLTVSSGFYVRSLCHDLGKAVGSLGIMARLVRVTQGYFELGRNVLDYEKLGMGEEVWRPNVEEMLHDWRQNQESAVNQLGESKQQHRLKQFDDSR